jgi:two-component system, OmpR family, alkaline phosphatase synthesis response regulator PhoP
VADAAKGPRILLVEDEPGLLLTLSDRLRREGYTVDTASDGDAGLEKGTTGGYDLLLLDVMLPKRNGLDVCRDLRQRGVSTPIIMLTARGQVVDKVVGLKLGADDYLPKPFEMMELLARIEARLRRHQADRHGTQEQGGSYQFGDVRIDYRSAEIYRGDERVELSAREYQLLKYLIEHRGATVSRDQLLNDVWGYNAMPSTRTVDVHVAWLRQKIEPNPRHPQHLLTVHGLGYKFVG